MKQTFAIELSPFLQKGMIKINYEGNILYWSVTAIALNREFTKDGSIAVPPRAFESFTYDRIGDRFDYADTKIETVEREGNICRLHFIHGNYEGYLNINIATDEVKIIDGELLI